MAVLEYATDRDPLTNHGTLEIACETASSGLDRENPTEGVSARRRIPRVKRRPRVLFPRFLSQTFPFNFRESGLAHTTTRCKTFHMYIHKRGDSFSSLIHGGSQFGERTIFTAHLKKEL